MLPGGKPEPGEAEIPALARELEEELGCRLDQATAFGRFEAPAANEPDALVRSSVYETTVSGEIAPRAEIEELLWIIPGSLPDVRLAPLLETRVLPALRARS
ncbi:NUDIX domain-containing protein [Phenylobacterium aquaticum]|uniref:NUDIX hydrolase n=1 Tax=Phenylobacterium aquaticum TaxID=1763816 RepID=UPI003014C3D6